jgi:hypothetical protein
MQLLEYGPLDFAAQGGRNTRPLPSYAPGEKKESILDISTRNKSILDISTSNKSILDIST